MTDYQIRAFTEHTHNGRPWHSAQVVTSGPEGNRIFVDDRWGSWTAYAVQPRGKGDRPEPGKRGPRAELAPHVARELQRRCPKRSRKAAA